MPTSATDGAYAVARDVGARLNLGNLRYSTLACGKTASAKSGRRGNLLQVGPGPLKPTATKKPGIAGLRGLRFSTGSLRQSGDLVRQPRNLSACIVLVDDAALRSLHQFRFCNRHRLQRGLAVAVPDRFLDGADRAAHLGAARFVDDGAA